MGIEVLTELKPEYARVACRGVLDVDEFWTVVERAFRFADSEGRKAVLVDIRNLTGKPFTTMDRYAGGKLVAELQRGCGSGIAFGLVGNEPMIDLRKFAETVATNRGALGRVFTDIDEAVDWFGEVADRLDDVDQPPD